MNKYKTKGRDRLIFCVISIPFTKYSFLYLRAFISSSPFLYQKITLQS